jgi:hypothetical protein
MEVITDLKFDVDLINPIESSRASLEPLPKKSKGEHQLIEIIGEMAMPASSEEIELGYGLEEQLETEISRYKGEEHTHQSPLLW